MTSSDRAGSRVVREPFGVSSPLVEASRRPIQVISSQLPEWFASRTLRTAAGSERESNAHRRSARGDVSAPLKPDGGVRQGSREVSGVESAGVPRETGGRVAWKRLVVRSNTGAGSSRIRHLETSPAIGLRNVEGSADLLRRTAGRRMRAGWERRVVTAMRGRRRSTCPAGAGRRPGRTGHRRP